MNDLAKPAGRFEMGKDPLNSDPVPAITVPKSDVYEQAAARIARSTGKVAELAAGYSKPPLTLATRDSNGYVPERGLIGREFTHTNGKVYRVTGFVWDAESDRWMLTYKGDDDAITCARGHYNFFSNNADDKARFILMS